MNRTAAGQWGPTGRGGLPPAGSSALPPGSGKVAQGNGRKFGSPQRTLSTCFLTAGEASALSGFKEGGKGGLYLSFLFHSLPALQPLLGWAQASLTPPSCLTLCVCLSVCLSCFLYEPSSPILLKSYPPGIRTIILGYKISALPAKHIVQPMPGQPGQSGLIFNHCFCLTQQMLPKALGRRVLGSPPFSGVHGWGQDGEGRALVCRGHS